jgi:hypothetical protein
LLCGELKRFLASFLKCILLIASSYCFKSSSYLNSQVRQNQVESKVSWQHKSPFQRFLMFWNKLSHPQSEAHQNFIFA